MPTLQNKLCAVAGAALLLAACNKKDPVAPSPPTGPVTRQEINNWMLDSMRYFYLWNGSLPAKADTSLDAPDFFYSLRNPDDPYSLLYDPGNRSTIPRSMLYNFGMDYNVISWPSAAGGVIGAVKLVMPGSGAAAAGFTRGSYFTRINGIVLTADNAASLTAAVLKDGTGSFTPATVDGATITEKSPINWDLRYERENPVYAATVLMAGNKKAGYLFYNSFTDTYNSTLQAVFQDFKNKGVTDLILDLRYNNGGSIAAAALLTVMIAPDITANSIFVQYTGNSHQGQHQLSFSDALSHPENAGVINFGNLQNARLLLPKVYILSGHQTISAAELTINNLKPYTQVIQIGATTHGKDKGAVVVIDQRSPKRIPWILQPITYRLANAKGEGNYTQGIAPQYVVDEMGRQPLTALGDVNDPLVAKALALISGNGRTSNTEHTVRMYYEATPQAKEMIFPR